jgi:hypothetical protein
MQLNVVATREQAPQLREAVLRETTTIGLRSHQVSRVIRPRRVELVETKYGPIHVKVSEGGYGAEQAKPEFSDCQRAAELAKVPVREVMMEAMVVHRGGGEKAH